MAEEFVQVRRKDDPDVILPQPLAVSALRHFPDWEPIPAEPEAISELPAAEPAPVEPAQDEPESTGRTRRSTRKTSADTTHMEGDAGNG